LEKAFRDSGFSETNLEMSLSQDGRDFAGQDQRREGDFLPLAQVMAASRYEADSEMAEMLPSMRDGMSLSASSARASVNLLI